MSVAVALKENTVFPILAKCGDAFLERINADGGRAWRVGQRDGSGGGNNTNKRAIGQETRAQAVRMHELRRKVRVERDLPLVAGAAARREASMVGDLRRGEGRGGGRDGEEKRGIWMEIETFFFFLWGQMRGFALR